MSTHIDSRICWNNRQCNNNAQVTRVQEHLAANIPAGIILAATGSDFKVDVGTGGTTRIADSPNNIALINDLAREDINTAQVAIESFISVAVIDHDQVPVPVNVPTGKSDRSCIGCEYTGPFR